MPPAFRYIQVAAAHEEGDIQPAFEVSRAYKQRLLQQPIPGIRVYTRNLLESLLAQGKLTVADLKADPDPDLGDQVFPAPAYRAKICRVLTNRIGNSLEFSYSLEMSRKDRRLDPTEDFLVNVKEGHCERFATALALMLRSIGIPARIVSGYRGSEPSAERGEPDGWYTVRESHAHVWVEALVQRPGKPGRQAWGWLTLDPTPTREAVARRAAAGSSFRFLWEDWKNLAYGSWRVLISDTSGGGSPIPVVAIWDELSRSPMAARLSLWDSRVVWSLLAVAVVVVVIFAARRVQRRSRRRRSVSRQRAGRRTAAAAFYSRFLYTVRKYGNMKPQSWQTPREFGDQVGRRLAESAAGVDLASMPLEIVARYYAVRYGSECLTRAEETALLHQIARLKAALAHQPETLATAFGELPR
jgi:hypothetical protein